VRSEVKGELYGESIMEEGGQGMLKRKARVVCITGNLSEFVIIDQGTGFLHRSTVMEQSQQFLTMRKRLECP